MKLSRNLVTASPWYILNWLGTSSQSYAYQTRFHVCPAFYLVRTSAPVCNDKNITKAVCKGPDVLRHRLRIRMIAHPPPGMVQTCLSGRFTSIRGIQPRDHWGGHWWNHREQVRCHPFFQHEPACQKVASEKPPVFTALNILHSERSHLQDLLHANMSSQAVAAKLECCKRDKGTGPAGYLKKATKTSEASKPSNLDFFEIVRSKRKITGLGLSRFVGLRKELFLNSAGFRMRKLSLVKTCAQGLPSWSV